MPYQKSYKALKINGFSCQWSKHHPQWYFLPKRPLAVTFLNYKMYIVYTG